MKRTGTKRRRVSRRVTEACTLFGVLAGEHPGAARWHDRLAQAVRDLQGLLAPGVIAMVIGESGSGKSSLLRLLARRAGGAGCYANLIASEFAPASRGRAILDQLSGDARSAVRILTQVGLGEPALFGRTLDELSDGQRARARLAIALSRPPRTRSPATRLIALDEFGSVLDRVGATLLAASVRRMIERLPHAPALVVATAHEDLVTCLRPDVLVRMSRRAIETWRAPRAVGAHLGERTGNGTTCATPGRVDTKRDAPGCDSSRIDSRSG
ncbi:MAG: hypothetical protein AB7G11_05005 [Phycisphaerales bacterium]